MEPVPSISNRLWRSHQMAALLQAKSTIYLTSEFDHFTKQNRVIKNKTIRSQFNHGQQYTLKLIKAKRYLNNRGISRLFSFLIYSINQTFVLFKVRPKVIIASYPHSYSVISCLFYKLFRPSTKLIVDIRDSILRKGNFLANLLNLQEIFLSYFWVKESDVLIGPGSQTLNYLNDFLPRSLMKNAKKKYLNVPFAYSALQGHEFLLSNSNQISKINLIFAGSLNPSFELDEIIDLVISNSKYFNLDIVGSGVLQNKLREKIRQEKIRNIRILGYLNTLELSTLFLSAQYGLMPYVDNNCFSYHFTNKYAEYLFHGLNIIVPKWCKEMSSFTEKNKIGITYSSFASLEKQLINKFLQKEKFDNQMKLKARKIYYSHFSPSKAYFSINKKISSWL